MDEARIVFNQIHQMTLDMMETPLVEDQNPVVKKGKNWDDCEIDVAGNSNTSIALKRRPYREMYYQMKENRSFNMKLIDGALVLLQYKFEKACLTKHRLSFFPNPDLAEFQENYSEYMEDALFFECIDPRNVVVPFRFDYDSRSDVVKELNHPESHLTLEQYHDCRIPVSRPFMPAQFIDFIVRNFYHLAFDDYVKKMHSFFEYFPETITASELGILHMAICESSL